MQPILKLLKSTWKYAKVPESKKGNWNNAKLHESMQKYLKVLKIYLKVCKSTLGGKCILSENI